MCVVYRQLFPGSDRKVTKNELSAEKLQRWPLPLLSSQKRISIVHILTTAKFSTNQENKSSVNIAVVRKLIFTLVFDTDFFVTFVEFKQKSFKCS